MTCARCLFTSATFYSELFQTIRDALLHQDDDEPGSVSWLAFPTAHKNHQINLHLLTTPVEGTSIRIFPYQVGPLAVLATWDIRSKKERH